MIPSQKWFSCSQPIATAGHPRNDTTGMTSYKIRVPPLDKMIVVATPFCCVVNMRGFPRFGLSSIMSQTCHKQSVLSYFSYRLSINSKTGFECLCIHSVQVKVLLLIFLFIKLVQLISTCLLQLSNLDTKGNTSITFTKVSLNHSQTLGGER